MKTINVHTVNMLTYSILMYIKIDLLYLIFYFNFAYFFLFLEGRVKVRFCFIVVLFNLPFFKTFKRICKHFV